MSELRAAAVTYVVKGCLAIGGHIRYCSLIPVATTPAVGQLHSRLCRSQEKAGLRPVTATPRLGDVNGGAISLNLRGEIAFIRAAKTL